MVFELDKLKSKKILAVIICISSFLFTGCNPYYGLEPYNETANWVSLEPQVILTYSIDDKGAKTSQEILMHNEQPIYLDIAFQSSQYCAFLADSTRYEDRLFSGEWSYRGDQLVFSLDEDFIFNGKYAELVFNAESEVNLPKVYTQKAIETAVLLGLPIILTILVLVIFIKKRKSGSPRTTGDGSLS